MKLWLDDIRQPPDDSWTWVKTVEEAIHFMNRFHVTHASLDHDLGEGEKEGRSLAYWMAEHDFWPSEYIAVHSSNVPGVQYMVGMIERYGPFRLKRVRNHHGRFITAGTRQGV